MTALLVDGTQVPDNASKCVAIHTPALTVITTALECNAAGCQYDGSKFCNCTPKHEEISLNVKAMDIDENFNTHPAHKLPPNPNSEQSEFSYVANLENISQSLNPSFLNDTPDALLDRMTFQYETVAPCMLSLAPPDDMYVHTFSFGRLGDTTTGPMSQAMAQMLVAKITVPDNTYPVTITLTGFKNHQANTMKLIQHTCDGGHGITQCIDVLLANWRPAINDPKSPCNDGEGRDFAFFYELVTHPPAWEARLVPHDDQGAQATADSLSVQECADQVKYYTDQAKRHSDRARHGTDQANFYYLNAMSRPICPMATFIP
jgi:hypothetical protein